MRYFYLIFFLTCVTVIGLAGFRGSKSRQPPSNCSRHGAPKQGPPQSPSEFFADGRSSRAGPEGRWSTASLMKSTGKKCWSTQGGLSL